VDLRSLLTTWNFKVNDEPLKRVEGHLNSMKQGMNALIGAQIVKGFIDIEQRFSKWAHELNSVSIASNVAAETIQQLSFAGAQFGATQEEMTGAMTSLTLKINEAKIGTEGAQRAFAMAGFTGAQLNSWKNGNDALMALADRMHAVSDPIRRQAMAAQLGISANSKLYATLSQGSQYFRDMAKEANELGVVLSGKQVGDLVGAQNAMAKFGMVLESVSKKIAAALAPGLKQMIDLMLTFYKANKKLFDIALGKWIDDLLYGLGFLYGAIEIVIGAVVRFAGAHPELFRRITQVIGAIILFGSALVALGVFLYPIIIAFNSFSTIIGGIKTMFALWPAVIGLAQGALASLRVALLWFQLFASANPIGLIVMAIAALVGVGVVLWEHFVTGKDWKDTWIGKMITGIKEFVSGTAGKIAKFFGFGGEEVEGKTKKIEGATTAISNLSAAPEMASAKPAQLASLGSAPSNGLDISNISNVGTNNYNQNATSENQSINTNVTINVQGGHNAHEIASMVKSGVADHVATTVRNAQRNLKSQAVH
jgi:hypothetical protein